MGLFARIARRLGGSPESSPYQRAYAEWVDAGRVVTAAAVDLADATTRGDDRDVGRCRAALTEAQHARLRAENVLFPPTPLPRQAYVNSMREGQT